MLLKNERSILPLPKGKKLALIGFAGQRVIKQTIGEDLPEGFQRAEFLKEHGFIDDIVARDKMKETLFSLINFFSSKENIKFNEA